jgi:hypothetical protein
MQFGKNTAWDFPGKKWGRLRENKTAKLAHRETEVVSFGEEIKESDKEILIYAIEDDLEADEI